MTNQISHEFDPQPEKPRKLNAAEEQALGEILDFTAAAAGIATILGVAPDSEEPITEQDLEDPEIEAAVRELSTGVDEEDLGHDMVGEEKPEPESVPEPPKPAAVVLVIGSVEFSRPEVVHAVLGSWIDRHQQFDLTIATSGAGRGAEGVATSVADARRVKTTVIRDEQIPFGGFATAFAFLEGESVGARKALDLAVRAGLGVTVVNIDLIQPFDVWAGR